MCGAGIELLELLVTQPLLVRLFDKMPDLSALDGLRGSWRLLLLGVIFLATGCNMWAAIIAHGCSDTLDILLLYLGKYPGI